MKKNYDDAKSSCESNGKFFEPKTLSVNDKVYEKAVETQTDAIYIRNRSDEISGTRKDENKLVKLPETKIKLLKFPETFEGRMKSSKYTNNQLRKWK